MRNSRTLPKKTTRPRERYTHAKAWQQHLSAARKLIINHYGSKEKYRLMMFETGCRFIEAMYTPDEEENRDAINDWIEHETYGFWTFWENEWRNWEAILVARFKTDPLWIVGNAQNRPVDYIDRHFEEALTCQRTKDSFSNWLKYLQK